MPLWDWVLQAYGRPGVPELTLELQDACGQNTSLLLWALWARAEDAAVLQAAAACARAWDETALIPIRAARRALKAPLPPMADTAREALREQVKAVELGAERLLLETLESLAGPGDGDGAAALEAAVRAWGRPAPRERLAALAAAVR